MEEQSKIENQKERVVIDANQSKQPEQEEVIQEEVIKKDQEIDGVKFELRKLTNNDNLEVRNKSLETEFINGLEKTKVIFGEYQKYMLVYGLKSCSFFEDTVSEAIGVTPRLVNKRLGEIKKSDKTGLTIEIIDEIYKLTLQYNQVNKKNINQMVKK